MRAHAFILDVVKALVRLTRDIVRLGKITSIRGSAKEIPGSKTGFPELVSFSRDFQTPGSVFNSPAALLLTAAYPRLSRQPASTPPASRVSPFRIK